MKPLRWFKRPTYRTKAQVLESMIRDLQVSEANWSKAHLVIKTELLSPPEFDRIFNRDIKPWDGIVPVKIDAAIAALRATGNALYEKTQVL